MLILPDTTVRHLEPELMDDPALDADSHRLALRALARINAVSRSAATLSTALCRQVADSQNGPVRVLDVACGGGDVMVDVARRAHKAGVPLAVHGCDLSPVALGHARQEAERRGVEADFFARDVLTEGLPDGYDLVCSSLFHHHLSREDAVGLLRAMAEAGHRVLVQDLLRGTLGYVLAWSGLRLLSRSDVARVDGPRSVRAAFTLSEVRTMAAEAGYVGAVVQRGWPERFILRWRRP